MPADLILEDQRVRVVNGKLNVEGMSCDGTAWVRQLSATGASVGELEASKVDVGVARFGEEAGALPVP